MPTRFIAFILLSMAVFWVAFPQAGAGQVGHSPMAFDHLTTANGLSHNTVYTILQDKNGLVWIGTRYGLNRYDGYECKLFLPAEGNEQSLNGPTVLTMLEDRQGKIWIGHREAGISVWDKGKFEQQPFDKDAEIDWEKTTVRCIYEDSRGWLWVGTLGMGVFVFNEKRQKIKHFCMNCEPKSAISGDFIFDILEDTNGRVWMAADGKGISAYDFSTKSTLLFNSKDSLNLASFEKSLCLDQRGNMWIGTAGSGLYKFDHAQNSFTHYFSNSKDTEGLSHNIVTDLALDPSGALWVATDGGGLNVLEPAARKFEHIVFSPSFPQSLNTNAIYHLMFDKIGNLWVGTFNGGINIHKAYSPPFQIHELQNEYRNMGLHSVLAIKEDQQGKIWVGTDGRGLFYAEANDNRINLQHAMVGLKKFPKRVVTCLEPSSNGGLWVGSFAEGLSYLDAKTGTLRNYTNRPSDLNSLSHNNVWDIAEDSAGGLWIGTLGGGLNFLAPSSNKFKQFRPIANDPNSISSVQIVDVLLDKNGKYLWAASEDKGLNRVELATGQIEHYTQESTNPSKRLSGNNLQFLYQDELGNIWVGMEFKGLNCLVVGSDTILFYSTKDGLPSNMVNSMAADEQGFLWIGTQKGIVRLEPKTKAFIDFGTDDNQLGNQYNPRSAIGLRDGRLVFGGTNGFSLLAPSLIRPNPHPPKAVFTDMKLSGQIVPIGKWNGRVVLESDLNDPSTIVHLSYADRGIIFEFTATDFTNPAKNKFAYQLEGFDNIWNYVGADHHRAVYSNLKGGKYFLSIKASNSDNIWGEARRLTVMVESPFWETWWFKSIFVVVVLGIAFLTIQYYLEHHKAIFQEKSFKSEQEILRLKNENLRKEIESKQSQLSASVLQSAHKNQFLADLKAQIQKTEGQGVEFRKVIRSIDHELNQADYWEQFQLSFNQMHQEFVHKLQECHPSITGNDIRLCCFVRMGMTNAEIASILNITVNGVEQSKYRLKRKMGLDKEASLNDYIKMV